MNLDADFSRGLLSVKAQNKTYIWAKLKKQNELIRNSTDNKKIAAGVILSSSLIVTQI